MSFLVVLVISCQNDAPGRDQDEASRYQGDIDDASRHFIRLQLRPQLTLTGSSAGQPFVDIVGVAVLSDGSLIVGDGGTKQVHRFTERGQHVWSAGEEGEGPGEFRRLDLVFITSKDTILVVDTWPSTYRLTIFSRDGEFVRSESLNSNASLPVALLSDRELLYRRSTLGNQTPEGLVQYQATWSAVDLAGESIRPLVSTFGGDTYFVRVEGMVVQIEPPFAREPIVLPAEGGFYLTTGREPSVVKYDSNGETIRSIRVPSLDRQITDDDVEDYHDWFLSRYPTQLRPAWRRRLQDMPVPDRLPSIGDLLIDSGGRLWIAAYRPPWVTTLTWYVFTPDGSLIGEIMGPEGFVPYSISDEILYGVSRDSLDVQSVTTYRIIGEEF